MDAAATEVDAAAAAAATAAATAAGGGGGGRLVDVGERHHGGERPTVEDVLARILALLEKEEKVSAIAAAAPKPVPCPPAVPCKGADKVELITITDPSNNPIYTARQNIKFTILDASGERITDASNNIISEIESPLASFDKYLDITKIAKKDSKIRDGIIALFTSMQTVISPFEKMILKLPDNEYGQPIRNALTKIINFHNRILAKATVDNLISIKEKAYNWYSRVLPKAQWVDSDVARKGLELLYSDEIALAIEIHEALVSAAADYFNIHIVYNNRGKTYGQELAEKGQKQDTSCKDICANIVGSLGRFEEIKRNIHAKYIPDATAYITNIDMNLPDKQNVTDALLTGITTDISGIQSKVTAISDGLARTPPTTPSVTQLTELEAAIISLNDRIKPDLIEFKRKLDTIITTLTSEETQSTDFNRMLELFEIHAPLSLKAKIGVELQAEKKIINDISNGIIRLRRPYDTLTSRVGTVEREIQTIDGDAGTILSNQQAAADSAKQAAAAQVTASMAPGPGRDPIFNEWDRLKLEKSRVTALFGMIATPTTDLSSAHTDVTNKYGEATTAELKYTISDTVTDASANLSSFRGKITDLSSSITLFDGVYNTYLSAAGFAQAAARGAFEIKKDYVRTFLEAVLINISTTTDPSAQVVTTTYKATPEIIQETITAMRVDISNNILSGTKLYEYAQLALRSVRTNAMAIQMAAGGAAAGGVPLPTAAEITAATAAAAAITYYIDNKLLTFVRTYIGDPAHTLPMRGGRYRVTRRRLTGSKRRKTYVRRAKNSHHQ